MGNTKKWKIETGVFGITSKRVYKDAFAHEMAMKISINEKGKLFDPDVVDACLNREKEFNMIREKMYSS